MTGSRGTARRSRLGRVAAIAAAGGLACFGLVSASAQTLSAHSVKPERGGSPLTSHVWVKAQAVGGLDCNGMSPVQKTLNIKVCTDIKGIYGIHNKYTWGGRFYDNGRYIGHDEPLVRFLSPHNGSGDNVVWNETLGRDPAALPTVKTPGKDVNHFFELTIAPWFGMALCNPFSYPLLPCKPESDINHPATNRGGGVVPPGVYPGAGSSFLEMQFYPPGQAPFFDNVSCDNTHWCASLHINDLECTENFLSCNTRCIEPTNFAFIQTNGVPTGPPSPQLSNVASNTPNSHTLLMNSGDHLKIHMWDAPVPGEPGQRAVKLTIDDLTTGKSGFMQASAKNGFMATNIQDCSGTPFNYQPEYNTARPLNIVPWAADQLGIASQFEIGHFEACTSLAKRFIFSVPGFKDVTWNKCFGPYENAGAPDPKTPEVGDAFCFPKGDTHFGMAPPNEVTGCLDVFFQNGDLDYDGNPYWPDWPNSTTPNTFPSTFQQAPPTSGGAAYPQIQFQTDAALSEPSCGFPNPAGCQVPPPAAPGKFYPYWTLTSSCLWEFGNMTNGNTFGKQAQYGHIIKKVGYPQLFGPIMENPCD